MCFNLFTDTVFVLLLITIILGLQVPKKNRIVLCVLLELGLLKTNVD